MENIKTGLFIKEQRVAKKMTQQQLAEQLFLTNKAISKWERGRGCPDVSILPQLAALLDVSVEELMHGERITIDRTPEPPTPDLEAVDVPPKKVPQKSFRNYLNRTHAKVILFLSIGISGLFLFLIILQAILNITEGIRSFLNIALPLLTAWFSSLFLLGGIPFIFSYTWYRLFSKH